MSTGFHRPEIIAGGNYNRIYTIEYTFIVGGCPVRVFCCNIDSCFKLLGKSFAAIYRIFI